MAAGAVTTAVHANVAVELCRRADVYPRCFFTPLGFRTCVRACSQWLAPFDSGRSGCAHRANRELAACAINNNKPSIRELAIVLSIAPAFASLTDADWKYIDHRVWALLQPAQPRPRKRPRRPATPVAEPVARVAAPALTPAPPRPARPAALRCKVHRLQASVRYWRDRACKFEKYWRAELEKRRMESLTIASRSRKAKDGCRRLPNLSTHGGMKLAVARNAGQSGAASVLKHLEAPADRRSVYVWEHRLANTLQDMSKQAYARKYAAITACNKKLARVAYGGPRAVTYELNLIKADATNTSILQSSKAHVLASASVFGCFPMGDVPGIDDHVRELSNAHILKSWGNLERVPTSCGGCECRAMTLRQIESVGIRPWTTPTLAQDIHHVHVRFFIFGADSGPDQKGCDGLVSREIMPQQTTLAVRGWCGQHQGHLIVVAMLKRLKPYWSQLATCVNTWRSHGNPRKIYKAYEALHGAAEAKAHARKLPPRPLHGRWGSKTAAEERLLSFGRRNVETCLKEALGGDPESAPRGPDEDDDEAESYADKRGRWIARTLRSISGHAFWVSLQISHVVGKPLDHWLRWQEKAGRRQAAYIPGNADQQIPPIVELVTGKGEEIGRDWNTMLGEGWADLWADFPAWIAPLSTNEEWVELAALATLEASCGYAMRILLPLRTFPRLWCWLVAQPARTVCKDRQLCARDMRQNAGMGLDSSTQKMVALFAEEIREAEEQGTLPEALHQCLTHVAWLWPCNTQDVEGTNGELKFICRTAPPLLWSLLNARLKASKFLGLAAAIAPPHLGKRGPATVREELLQQVSHHYVEHMKLLKAPMQDPGEVDVSKYPLRLDAAPQQPRAAAPSAADHWASWTCCKIRHAMQAKFYEWKPSAKIVLLVSTQSDPSGESSASDGLYMLCFSYRRALWATKFKVAQADGDDVVLPLLPLENHFAPLGIHLRRVRQQFDSVTLPHASCNVHLWTLSWDRGGPNAATVLSKELLVSCLPMVVRGERHAGTAESDGSVVGAGGGSDDPDDPDDTELSAIVDYNAGAGYIDDDHDDDPGSGGIDTGADSDTEYREVLEPYLANLDELAAATIATHVDSLDVDGYSEVVEELATIAALGGDGDDPSSPSASASGGADTQWVCDWQSRMKHIMSAMQEVATYPQEVTNRCTSLALANDSDGAHLCCLFWDVPNKLARTTRIDVANRLIFAPKRAAAAATTITQFDSYTVLIPDIQTAMVRAQPELCNKVPDSVSIIYHVSQRVLDADERSATIGKCSVCSAAGRFVPCALCGWCAHDACLSAHGDDLERATACVVAGETGRATLGHLATLLRHTKFNEELACFWCASMVHPAMC